MRRERPVWLGRLLDVAALAGFLLAVILAAKGCR